MSNARLALPCLPDAVSARVVTQQIVQFAAFVRDGQADRPTVEAFVAIAERAFLHSDEAPRRAILKDAVSDPRLAEILVGTVFPRVARLLEDGWNSDRLSFVDITIAATRLQDAVRRLGHFTLPARAHALAMIVPPWEQHGLPPSLAAAQLRRMGAPTRLIQGVSTQHMLALIARSGPAGVLISVGSHRSAGKLRPLIGALRAQVQRPLPIVVGGPALEANAATCRQSGADLATSDLRAALSFCDFALDENNTLKSGVDA